MQLLNLLYSDGELANLLVHGVECVHYIRREDGTIEPPEGLGWEKVGYKNNLPWLMPNQGITYTRHGNDPSLWEKLREFNKSAAVSEAIGFNFEAGAVKLQNDALNFIESRYVYGLETGQLDPAIYLPKMLEEMDAAGAEQVTREAQSQYGEFRERRKTSL
jgi:putative aldouronate transport system substrate-binding protein